MAVGLLKISQAFLVSTLLALLVPALALALEAPPKPSDIPIVDQTNTLTQEQKTDLAGIIARERAATGNQIAVLMIPSLKDEALEDYSLKVARTWGVGQKDRNSGVLLLIAKDDREMRIEVGNGLEGALPDIRAGRIIRDRITPEFRQDKYYEGIKSGVDGIITAIHGEADPNLSNNSSSNEEGAGFPFAMLFWGIFILPTWLSAILARSKSWWAGGVLGGGTGGLIGWLMGSATLGLLGVFGLGLIGLLFDRAVSRNYHNRANRGLRPSWWAGGTYFGGGGGRGGGFGGFGGGGFGGGGASGRW